MSDFEVRPVDGYRPPRYPGADQPLIANRPAPPASRLLPLALFAIVPMTTPAHAKAPIVAVDSRRPSVPDQKQALCPDVTSLIALVRQQQPPPPPGKPAPARGLLTEGEVVGLLRTWLADRGLELKPATVTRDGVSLRFIAADVALIEHQSPAGIEELALLKARGEMRTLILDRDDYAYEFYDRATGGLLPSREAAIRRLTAELERTLKP